MKMNRGSYLIRKEEMQRISIYHINDSTKEMVKHLIQLKEKNPKYKPRLRSIEAVQRNLALGRKKL